jgi:hypothetical protein
VETAGPAVRATLAVAAAATGGFLAGAGFDALFVAGAAFLVATDFAGFFFGAVFARDGIVFLRVAQFGRDRFSLTQIETEATFEQEKTVGRRGFN